jgi:predicted nucleotidyltransferase component of viral defense system
MDRTSSYYKQVQLLVQLLPIVAEEHCFALKGGTAINLFIRELPRLSVDIDLVYLPMKARDEALNEIREALARTGERIRSVFTDSEVIESFRDKMDAMRLVISRSGVQIKIELSPVLRGTVFEPEILSVCEKVEDEFGYAEIAVVNRADLYAGKICAALDRQHPRDLFDVMWLLNPDALTDDLRKALIVYLISHSRPISELLSRLSRIFKRSTKGSLLICQRRK